MKFELTKYFQMQIKKILNQNINIHFNSITPALKGYKTLKINATLSKLLKNSNHSRTSQLGKSNNKMK